jgi:hypothetical protein
MRSCCRPRYVNIPGLGASLQPQTIRIEQQAMARVPPCLPGMLAHVTWRGPACRREKFVSMAIFYAIYTEAAVSIMLIVRRRQS